MKKWIVLLLILFLAIFAITGCDGVGVPTEGEGEGEGEEEVQQVVLVEAYVAEGCESCKVVEPHLEQLAEEYGRDEMILVEVIPWYGNATPNGKERYQWYSLSGGTPQILFNGLVNPITGTSNYSTIKNRITAQLGATPKISIEASREASGENTVINGSIKNISDSEMTNLVINGMTFKSKGDFPYAVTNIFEDQKVDVPSLAAGESKSFTITLDGINWDGEGKDGVVFVQETTGKKIIRQSLFIN
jgi:thiol-disulfide isomerase/thioredoxin